MTARERLLDELRPVAFAIAYRMLGSAEVSRPAVGVAAEVMRLGPGVRWFWRGRRTLAAEAGAAAG
jgi:hypothetical protein